MGQSSGACDLVSPKGKQGIREARQPWKGVQQSLVSVQSDLGLLILEALGRKVF